MFKKLLLIFFLVISTALTGCDVKIEIPKSSVDSESIPDFDGKTYNIVINENKTYFTNDDLKDTKKEEYYTTDDLGRCQVSTAYISRRTITKDSRDNISSFKPTGWQSTRYDKLVDGGSLYNRSHLIGFQFIGNSSNNENNLITGTRFFNASEEEGMLRYETQIRCYLNWTKNHVKYRVTPIYDGDDLVAKGVLMEAKSVEDHGKGLEFCVFVYNEQPKITIDHKTGESHIQIREEYKKLRENNNYRLKDYTIIGNEKRKDYIININTKKFHTEKCHQIQSIRKTNRRYVKEQRSRLIAYGYIPCQGCHP